MNDLIERADGTLALRTNSDPSTARLEGHRRFWLGLDPGSLLDPSAFVLIKDEVLPFWEGTRQALRDRTFAVVWCDLLKESDWPTILQYTTDLLTKPLIRGKVKLAIDGTGPGRPLSDFLITNKVEHMCVTITAATQEANVSGRYHNCGKSELLGGLAVGLEQGHLTIAHNTNLRQQLIADLGAFSLKTTAAGNTVINAVRRDGSHADLGIATALALYAAKKTWVGSHVGKISTYWG